ncbi:MAG: protein-glutamate O-methyltransferase CheR [Bacillaceae bacterium]|nr:protein-glutamate O-methyltransferase CheR [Bacillaceae bacterium]
MIKGCCGINTRKEKTDEDVAKIEVSLLLEAVYRRYGYDFRNYSPASLHRRITHRMNAENACSISELQGIILHDPKAMQRLIQGLSINVTEMFRDPCFFRSLRNNVLPLLKKKSKIRIWHAGCSSGEEVYSMAILLHELGLYDQSVIYGTDMNEIIVKKASQGKFPFNRMRLYTKNYIKAGGVKEFSNYYHSDRNAVFIQDFLKENIVFSTHNLVTDFSFNEFDLILCRNVLIYFDQQLKVRVYELLHDSLAADGFVCFGNKEQLISGFGATLFQQFDSSTNIHKKIERKSRN